jgi:predicted nucleic acid-binding protein
LASCPSSWQAHCAERTGLCLASSSGHPDGWVPASTSRIKKPYAGRSKAVELTLDANVLLYASDETSAYHPRARVFLERVAGGDELLYLFWPTAIASADRDASGDLRAAAPAGGCRGQPRPTTRSPARADGRRAGSVLALLPSARSGSRCAGANLVPDAHLVTLMVENGVRTIWTHDRDYRRLTRLLARGSAVPETVRLQPARALALLRQGQEGE